MEHNDQQIIKQLQAQLAEKTAQLLEVENKLKHTYDELERTIAEQQQTEEALRESESKYRLLTENASDVVWRLDSEYRFTYVSPADERLRGYKADEVLGRHVFEMFNEDGIAAIKKMAQQRLEAERRGIYTDVITFEAEHRCKDGSWLWAEIRYSAERDVDGKVTGFHGITREITERKLAEDETRRAKAVAEEASKAKSQFLATMSHEIRTPLNALVGFSTLARKATDPAKINQYLSILEHSSRSLMDLVNDILDVSKIDAGRLELEAMSIHLRQFLASLEEQYHHLAAQKMLTFRVTVDDRIPSWVLGDPIRLRQILTNLLANAVKFTENGEISCTISRHENGTDQLIRFEVRDSGIGIPASFLTDIFSPFRQLDPTISRKFGGSGLGLAIVHSLVKLMKGTIAVKSTEGVGSCFIVDLPLQETEPLSEKLFAVPVMLEPSEILVVEDNRFNRQLLGDILTSWGHLVTLTENGHQALVLAEQQPFDLVLLDIRMPGIDGIEVARRIRQREQERSQTAVPIIAITADTDIATREACHMGGINAVLQKPLIPDQLARVIATQLEGTKSISQKNIPQLTQQTLVGLSNNPKRIDNFQQILVTDIANELQCLRNSLAQGDRNEFRRAAHTLKGLYGYMTKRQPVELASWLVHHASVASTGELWQIVEQLSAIEAECPQRLQEYTE
ncbi:PAS domain-containing hybrid sensor histidine kinase/response regulator [Chrysiogenes arsenatis]|uniref:PAS domain-containing hybrid sensor histidine kinase/response regulator n=1 Tax=Chrysiogenes arsenatis TaxID=309797 RepID=UPI0004163595|nr:PAS domain-containing hybrid sensor histidine kinase/response regulator [Chrysiogenes arsenatis]